MLESKVASTRREGDNRKEKREGKMEGGNEGGREGRLGRKVRGRKQTGRRERGRERKKGRTERDREINYLYHLLPLFAPRGQAGSAFFINFSINYFN